MKFRQGQWVTFIDPSTGETRQGKYRGSGKDGGMLIQGGNGKYLTVPAEDVSPPDEDLKRKRRNLAARIERTARIDYSVMANPKLKIEGLE
jgi:hypothetical protein